MVGLSQGEHIGSPLQPLANIKNPFLYAILVVLDSGKIKMRPIRFFKKIGFIAI
jgi:hypothetical protein